MTHDRCQIPTSNFSGEPVYTLHLGEKPAGVYETKSTAIHWDGRNDRGEQVSSGVYFYTLQTEGEAVSGKMLLVK